MPSVPVVDMKYTAAYILLLHTDGNCMHINLIEIHTWLLGQAKTVECAVICETFLDLSKKSLNWTKK